MQASVHEGVQDAGSPGCSTTVQRRAKSAVLTRRGRPAAELVPAQTGGVRLGG
jgi:hypothetical protein